MRYGCINHFHNAAWITNGGFFSFLLLFFAPLWIVSVCLGAASASSLPACASLAACPPSSLALLIHKRWRQQSLSLFYFRYLDRGKGEKKETPDRNAKKKKWVSLSLAARSKSKPRRVYWVLPSESLPACPFSLVGITAQTISVINPAGGWGASGSINSTLSIPLTCPSDEGSVGEDVKKTQSVRGD